MSNQAPLSDGFEWRPTGAGAVLRCAALADIADHFFTSRDLPLRSRDTDGADAWARAAAAIGVSPGALVSLVQVHGAASVVVRDAADASALVASRPRADIVVSTSSDVALAVQAADCVPLLVADRATGAVAAAHAGWRGTAVSVATHTVRALAEHAGARPADLEAAVGPSIGPCCYQVGADVRDAFAAAGHPEQDLEAWFAPDGDGRYRLDLWRATRDQLLRAGVPAPRIHVAGACTSTLRHRFYSYRAEGTAAGRIIGVIRARRTPTGGQQGALQEPAT